MDKKFSIREIYIEELKESLDLIWNVFLEYVAPGYSDEGVQEFKKYIDYDAIKEKVIKSEVLIWGCFEDKRIVGVIAIKKPNRINLLFVDRDYHKQGIAKELFNVVVEYYKQKEEHIEITVNSSPYAKEIYQKLGFKETDVEQVVNGIRFTPMKIEI